LGKNTVSERRRLESTLGRFNYFEDDLLHYFLCYAGR
jgi:hypothetical protein